MASSGKKKTTMAKLTRESRLRERRLEKKARKAARKLEAADQPLQAGDAMTRTDQWPEARFSEAEGEAPPVDSADEVKAHPAAGESTEASAESTEAPAESTEAPPAAPARASQSR